MGCVYLITSPSGKQYVGQTIGTLSARWRSHVWDALNRLSNCRALANAISKYGAEAFMVETLHETDDLDELNRLEAFEIAERGTIAPSGYNLRTGGDNSRPSEETLARQTEGLRRRFSDQDWVKRRAASLKQTLKEPEARARMAAASRACWDNPEVRQRLTKQRRAMWKSEDYRAKRQSALKAFWDGNSEQREKVGSASKAAHEAVQRSIFIEGRIFSNLRTAHEAIGVERGTIGYRCNESRSLRFRWWFALPNHRDPMHDGLEECAAILEWAKANPDHENVPDWARPYLDRVPKHGVAPAWARERAAARV